MKLKKTQIVQLQKCFV